MSDSIITKDKMRELLARLQRDEGVVWVTKNDDYAERGGDGNALANFDEIAKDVGLPVRVVIWVYMTKHLRSIKAYVRHGDVESEGLWSRFIDIRNYCALMAADAVREEKIILTKEE